MPQVWVKQGNLGRQDSCGAAAIPALALGAATNVTVTLDRAMPTANYRCTASISAGASLLGSVQVQGIVSRTATQVVVRVVATAVLTTGASVEVACVAR